LGVYFFHIGNLKITHRHFGNEIGDTDAIPAVFPALAAPHRPIRANQNAFQPTLIARLTALKRL